MHCMGIQAATRAMAITLISFGVAFALSPTAAQGARLDPSFGGNGFVATPTGPPTIEPIPSGLIEDGLGRLVVAGSGADGRFVVARYLANGQLDPSFGGGDGLSAIDLPGLAGASARALALQEDGKIVVVGAARRTLSEFRTDLAFVRLNPDGRPDQSFGFRGDGTVVVLSKINGLAVEIQRDGKIVISGAADKGDADTAGYVARYLPNGRPDRGFANRGTMRFGSPSGTSTAIRDIHLLPSGQILATGHYRNRLLLARLRANGSRDPLFGGGNGQTTRDIARCSCSVGWGLEFDDHGGIVVAGHLGRPQRADSNPPVQVLVARFRPSGSFDRSFGRGGIERTRVGRYARGFDPAIQRDGRIVVAGQLGQPRDSRFMVLRYKADGGLDRSFFRDGILARRFSRGSFDWNAASDASLDDRGRVVVGGAALTADPGWSLVTARMLPGPSVRCMGEYATLTGTRDHDRLVGTPARDVIVGFAGNDRIIGGGHRDLICSGDGVDRVTAGGGPDKLNGGAGDDKLWGRNGGDGFLGGPGGDLLGASWGADRAFGHAGSDRLFGAKGNDGLFGNGGNDVVAGGDGSDNVRGGPARDRVRGGRGNDSVRQ